MEEKGVVTLEQEGQNVQTRKTTHPPQGGEMGVEMLVAWQGTSRFRCR